MLFLNAAQVWRSLPMGVAVEAMREALIDLSRGDTTMPLRTQLSVDAHAGRLLVMPGHVVGSSGESLAVKLVSSYAANTERGLPALNAIVIALDPETGVPSAILEGASLTAIRTAAASAAATAVLARTNANILTVFGAGVQAHSHVLAMCTVRNIRRIHVCARRPAQARALVQRLVEHDGVECDLKVEYDAVAAASQADIICTTTPSREPLFSGSAVSAGCHINAVGAFLPDMQEIPDDCVAAARVFVDHMASAMQEAGDLLGPMARRQISPDHVIGEIGAVLAGDLRGRTSDRDITLFKSVGNAVEDAVAAATTLAGAHRLRLGTVIDL